MHLCFGVLASLLLTCRKTLKNGRGLVTQSQMVARLAWCVDPSSSYFSSSHASVNHEPNTSTSPTSLPSSSSGTDHSRMERMEMASSRSR